MDEDRVDYRPLVQFLYDHAGYGDSCPSHMDAKSFHDAFERVAHDVYGPKRFVPFHMPAP